MQYHTYIDEQAIIDEIFRVFRGYIINMVNEFKLDDDLVWSSYRQSLLESSGYDIFCLAKNIEEIFNSIAMNRPALRQTLYFPLVRINTLLPMRKSG